MSLDLNIGISESESAGMSSTCEKLGWVSAKLAIERSDNARLLENMKGEIAKQSHQISEYKRLSLDVLSLFEGGGESIATAERVEAWKAKWNELNEHNYKIEELL